MAGSRADGAPIYAPEWLDVAALLGTRPRACRPYRAKTKGKVERVIREVKEDFLAWLTGQVLPERPTLAWYDAQPRGAGRSRSTRRAATGRPGGSSARRGPTSGRSCCPSAAAWSRGWRAQDTLVPLPAPASARGRPLRSGETVEVRPLAVYAELAR